MAVTLPPPVPAPAIRAAMTRAWLVLNRGGPAAGGVVGLIA